jgi:hypothetical protein
LPEKPSGTGGAVNEFSIDSARLAEQQGRLDAWVAEFLSSPGSDNPVLAEELRSHKRSWCGPVRLRFDDLHRLAGPPDQPTLAPMTDDDLDTVEEMGDSIEDGWEAPPLIVSYRNSQLVVEDGNHRIEGLRRCGHREYWAVVGFDDDDQRQAFMADVSAER